MREVDELILVDIEATKEGRDPDYESIRDFRESVLCRSAWAAESVI